MNKSNMNYIGLYKVVFWQLLRTEFIELRKTFLNKAIDLAIWVVCSVLVWQYFMGVHFNIAQDLNVGVFNLAGCIATIGLFDAYTYTFGVVSDLEDSSIISYYLTLPIPSWFIFVCKIIHWTLSFLFKVLIAFPLGKLILWDTFALADIDFVRMFIVILMSNLLYGAFTLLISSAVYNVARAESVWMRIIFPLWFFGGDQFSWETMHKISPIFSYFSFLNPVIYVMESTRAIMLGQAQFLRWDVCLLMIFIFTVIFSFAGIYRMKKRLDFV